VIVAKRKMNNFPAMVCRDKVSLQWHGDDRYEDLTNLYLKLIHYCENSEN